MKNLFFILLFVFIDFTSYSQKIDKFDLKEILNNNSNIEEYSIRVKFDKKIKKEERWILVLQELEKKYSILSENIIYKKEFIRKKIFGL
jgi:hypothetical protein